LKAIAVAFAAGALFALGLVVSGMTEPAKVIGFLSVAHHWDPSLAFVMGGGIAVYAAFVRLARARQAPVFDSRFHWPTVTAIDLRLVGGSVLFGIGWGLSGYCPGPALTSLPSGATGTIVFVVAMVVGIAATRAVTADP